MKDERFRWSLDSARAALFARELGWSVTAHADSTSSSGSTGARWDQAIVSGEEVIEATNDGIPETPTPSADGPNV